MFWIPVAFVCAMGTCFFISGPAEFSERACEETLQQVAIELTADPVVQQFATTCVPAQVS